MFNQFPNRVNLPCIFHKTNNCTHICMDNQCASHPYLCNSCMTDSTQPHSHHEYSINLIEDGINQITRSLHNYKTEFEKTLSGSMKKYKQAQLDTISSKLNSNVDQLKSKISIVVEKLVSQFKVTAESFMQSLFEQLDRNQKVRMSTIEIYKDTMSHFQQFEKLKFYSNTSTVYLKIKTQWNKKSIDWVQKMKKYIKKSQQMLVQQPNFISLLNQNIQEMANQQVGFVEQQITKQISRSMEDLVANILKQRVFIRSKSDVVPRKKYRVH